MKSGHFTYTWHVCSSGVGDASLKLVFDDVNSIISRAVQCVGSFTFPPELHFGCKQYIATMRFSPRLLASPVTTRFKPGQATPKLAILPPIPLYRRLLRTHRKKLGSEERVMGDLYLKAEFRRHRDIDNPIHIIGFLSQWQQYGQMLEGDDWKGQKLDVELLDKLSDQQVGQMYELMQEIQKIGRESADEEIEESNLVKQQTK